MSPAGWDENGFGFKHGFTVSDEMLTAIGCTVICQSHLETQFMLFDFPFPKRG